MADQLRIFIDFWNFQLAWDKQKAGPCDWYKLPKVIRDKTSELLVEMGLSGELDLEETVLHASVNPLTEVPLRRWLSNTVDRIPSYRVRIRERHRRDRTIHCRECNTDFSDCPNCNEKLTHAPEKGVDSAIVTELLTLAWQDAYDVAVIVSGDADYVPAVEYLQQHRGLKIVNAGWNNSGHDLKKACWGAISLDGMVKDLVRP